jgi:hypothetical protein
MPDDHIFDIEFPNHLPSIELSFPEIDNDPFRSPPKYEKTANHKEKKVDHNDDKDWIEPFPDGHLHLFENLASLDNPELMAKIEDTVASEILEELEQYEALEKKRIKLNKINQILCKKK